MERYRMGRRGKTLTIGKKVGCKIIKKWAWIRNNSRQLEIVNRLDQVIDYYLTDGRREAS